MKLILTSAIVLSLFLGESSSLQLKLQFAAGEESEELNNDLAKVEENFDSRVKNT